MQEPGAPVELRMFAFGAAQTLAATQGRLHQATDDARRVSELAMSQGRSEETYNAFIDIAVLNAVYRNDPARGKRYIDSVLAARPLASVPAEQRPYLNLAWTYAMLGDVTRARALMADAAAAADTTQASCIRAVPATRSSARLPWPRTGRRMR